MGTTYRYIEKPKSPSEVLEWFRALPQPPVEHPTPHGLVLYFRDMGPLVDDAKGAIDASKCPVVNLFVPKAKRGVLWTVGEVHFLATPLRQLFPDLHKISSKFSRWLSAKECVFTKTSVRNPFDYYLEGSVRNFNRPIFAFESGLAAIRGGRYFVADGDNDSRLDTICKFLSLRGVECAEAA
jgi:hypothetical protein